MKRALTLLAACLVLAAARADQPPQAPNDDKESGYLEELINRCLEEGGLKSVRDPKSGERILDKGLGTPQVTIADAAKLRATLSANRKLLTVRVRHGLVGLAKLCDPPGRPVWLYLLRTVAEVTEDSASLEVAAVVAAQLGLPRPTDAGLQQLKELVRRSVEAGGLQVAGTRLIVADAAKLKAVIVNQRALVTPDLLDTAVATSHRLDHAVLLRAIGEELADRRAQAFAAYFSGRARRREAQPAAAIKEYEDAVARFAALKDTPWKAQALSGLASAHEELYEHEKALNCYRQALTILNRVHEGKHRDIAVLLYNIAGVYAARSEYQRALFYQVQAFPIFESIKDVDPADVAAVSHQMGIICRKTGLPAEALEHYQGALTIYRRFHGDKDPRVATVLKNIGYVYMDLRDYPRARTYFEEALALRSARNGPEHPDVAQSLLDKGFACGLQGDYATAWKAQQQALAILHKTYGPRHPLVATALHNLGHVALLQQDDVAALEHFNRALLTLATEAKKVGEAGELSAVDFQPSSEVVHLLKLRGDLLQRQADRDRGNQLRHLRAAQRAYRMAADVLDVLRESMPGEDDKVRAGASVFALFPAWIGMCRKLHELESESEHLHAAVEAAERGTARAFLDALGQPVAQAVGGVSDELRSREQQLIARLGSIDYQYGSEISIPLEDRKSPARAAQLLQQRKDVDTELSALRVQLKEKYPQYAAFRTSRRSS